MARVKPYPSNRKTKFVRLPAMLRRKIDGGCTCSYCKEHPNEIPQWDAIGFDEPSYSWTVHYPELKEGGPR